MKHVKNVQTSKIYFATYVVSTLKRAYLAYFGVKIGDQDKAWVAHIVCKTCTEHLRQWNKGKRRKLYL